MNYVTFAPAGNRGSRGEVHMSGQRDWRELRRWGRRGRRLPWRAAVFAAAVGLAACSTGWHIGLGNGQSADPGTVDYPIFYVKRAVPVDQNGVLVQDDLRIMRDISTTFAADLYMRASASPSATETNITSRITAGAVWNVKDVD